MVLPCRVARSTKEKTTTCEDENKIFTENFQLKAVSTGLSLRTANTAVFALVTCTIVALGV
jgi:hypothetical protein